MSIFSSKKTRPREADVDRSKQRTQTANGTKPDAYRQAPKNGAANGALSAGARTIQRAQIMAASRRRMNSETPDYSIDGAAKSNGTGPRSGLPSAVSVSAARQAAQNAKGGEAVEPKSRINNAPVQNLTKSQKPRNDDKKTRASSINNTFQNGTTTPIYAALQTTNPATTTQKPNEIMNPNGTISKNTAIQKTPPLSMDSPTLGHDGFSKFQPPSKSASSQATPLPLTNTTAQASAGAVHEIRVGRLSRNDSGLSEPSTSRDASQQSGPSKSSSLPPGMRAEEMSNRSSRSSTYISRLDPGPSGSPFAEPVDSSKAASTPVDTEEANKRLLQTNKPQKSQLADSDARQEGSKGFRERSAPAIVSPVPKGPNSTGLNKIVTASQTLPISKFHSSSPPSREGESKGKSFTQPTRSSTPPPVNSRGIDVPKDAAIRTYTLPTPSPANADTFRTAPTSTSNTPPRSRDSKHRKDKSTESQSSISYFSKPFAPQETQSPTAMSFVLPQPDPARSSLSGARSALPPISVLEGLKVNKRGHVLDEEGDVVGELFEGDLIDCIRQKIDAHGDVLDESGISVGRVRTVVKGTIAAPRWSISSASGVGLPLNTYQWGRPDSTASQQSQPTFFNRGSVSHVTPPVIEGNEGNAAIAELDASIAAEAAPTMDHSDIFSPFGKASDRCESPSALDNMSELAAEERPISQPDKPEAKQESVAEMPKPVRKWTSRYFESSPIEGQLSSRTSRRNSATADMVKSPTTIISPKSPSSIYGAVSASKSRAVIGPTLESLMEQDPDIFSNKAERQTFGGSTPNLPLGASKSGSSTPRTNSTQFGPPAAGLGSTLSVKSAYPNHQPARRSPLGNYETTPPGSGVATSNSENDRAMSLPSNAPKTYITKGGKVSVEADDAAPAPEISRRKWQEKRALRAVPSADKAAEKRKSRFSFILGKKD